MNKSSVRAAALFPALAPQRDAELKGLRGGSAINENLLHSAEPRVYKHARPCCYTEISLQCRVPVSTSCGPFSDREITVEGIIAPANQTF
jgi:hypothetical protein